MVARSLHGHFNQRSAVVLVIAAVAAFGFQVLQRRLGEAVGLSYTAAVRKALFRHLMSVDPQVVRNRKHGAMLQSFVGDLTALRQWVSDGVVRSMLAVIALAGMLIWVGYSRPQVALFLFAIVALISATGAALLPLLGRAVTEVRRERGRVAAFASERLSAQSSVLAFGRARTEVAKLDRRVDRLNSASLRRAWITGVLRALPPLATTAMLAAVVLAEGSKGAIGVAGSVVVVGILGLALRDLARAGELIVPGRVSTERITRLLQLPSRGKAEERTIRRKGESGLVIDCLMVDASGPPWSAHAKEGDVVLLEGASQLRWNLFAILCGLTPPLSGSVRWNGLELIGLRSSLISKTVGIAAPELPLLTGSASHNVRYRAKHLSEDEVRRLLELWDLDPQDALVETHRSLILRAIAGSPPILLLDLAQIPLQDCDLLRLANALRGWAGVVILTSEQRALHRLATRIWKITPAGLADHSVGDFQALSLVESADARSRA